MSANTHLYRSICIPFTFTSKSFLRILLFPTSDDLHWRYLMAFLSVLHFLYSGTSSPSLFSFLFFLLFPHLPFFSFLFLPWVFFATVRFASFSCCDFCSALRF